MHISIMQLESLQMIRIDMSTTFDKDPSNLENLHAEIEGWKEKTAHFLAFCPQEICNAFTIDGRRVLPSLQDQEREVINVQKEYLNAFVCHEQVQLPALAQYI